MSDPADSVDPVGATEIAARLGIGRPTVERWQERHAEFPKRRWTVGGRPAWDWHADILPWLQATNRPTGAPMDATATYDMNTHGLADLALPADLEQRLADAPWPVRGQVEDIINARLAESGWDGDWSAEAIVRDALDTP